MMCSNEFLPCWGTSNLIGGRGLSHSSPLQEGGLGWAVLRVSS